MIQKRLSFYEIDMKYVRELSQKDDKVMSVSPQVGKENRPFVGIIVICDNKEYCVPLTSPKKKHANMKNDLDFIKIMVDGKIIGALNINCMIPVNSKVLCPLELKVYKNDHPNVKNYKVMAKKQLNWCQQNQDVIVNKANKLYRIVTETPEKSRNLTRRCCDFKKLEGVLQKYLGKTVSHETKEMGKEQWNKRVEKNRRPDGGQDVSDNQRRKSREK